MSVTMASTYCAAWYFLSIQYNNQIISISVKRHDLIHAQLHTNDRRTVPVFRSEIQYFEHVFIHRTNRMLLKFKTEVDRYLRIC